MRNPLWLRKNVYLCAPSKKPKMAHLSEMQRYKLSWMLENKFSKTRIANELGVNRSTVHRELKRNRNRQTDVYDPKLAQQKYKRRMRDKPKRIRFTDEMKRLARDKLELQWRPEQITGRCRMEGIDMVSAECLYQWIYRDKLLGGTLYLNLPHRGRKRQKRANKNDYRGLIPQRKDISLRPKVVEERNRLGDIEIDTVVGRGRSGDLVTMTDRASGLLWACLVPTLETSVVCPAIVQVLLPYKDLLKTLTFDNGREFSRHYIVSSVLESDSFFTRPYHSWEKGSIENANGLLRQYFRKGSSFEHLSQDDVRRACDLINNRPRKRFGFLSPREVFYLYLHQQTSQHFTSKVLRL